MAAGKTPPNPRGAEFHDPGACALLAWPDGRRAVLDMCDDTGIPPLIEAGVDCLQPLEAKANMDVRELKAEYGDRLAFMGNIDTRKMADPDPRVIEEEIRTKLEVAKQGGGYIYHSDHSIAPGVRWETYQYLMQLVDEYGRY